ncbi:hypothetical protein [Pseudalkalibacillus berkeleyi]|uniref:Uncharacterized protein n=1 Tax=Pseudalkalibacillus berkeleyi TaxID=1069813 RepID=A0ABS9GTH6_9BACL|nr:hypothetical protein [Pseudalkalibacillus berkeleyi]MCF6136144.1 hypothetical protein [Pseudalkalibacillus berkeleyi]
MSICPVCNQLSAAQYRCPSCLGNMKDSGRVMDYYDDYSPYFDIDSLKMEDGYPDDEKEKQCPHVFYCVHCASENVLLIHEWRSECN